MEEHIFRKMSTAALLPSILPRRVLCPAARLGNGSSSQWPLDKLEYRFLTVCMCRINYLTSLFRERESNGLLTFCCCCSTVPGSVLSCCSYLSVYVLIICHSRHEIALAKALGQKYARSMACGVLRGSPRVSSVTVLCC